MVRVPPPPPGTVDVTSFHMVAAREPKWSGGEVGRCCNSVVKTSMPRQRERESFHRFLSFLSLLFSPSSPQAVISKRIQNAKSEKFFGNIHKRGLVQNTTQVRERKRKRERGREKSGAISEEAEFEKKKGKTRRASPLLSPRPSFLSLQQRQHLFSIEEKGHGLQRRAHHARLLPLRRRRVGAAADHSHGHERGTVLIFSSSFG